VSISEAAVKYLRALQTFCDTDDLKSGLDLQQAFDDLLAIFAPGIPDEHLASAFNSYRNALLSSANMSTRPIGANA
jgi:hypothetical protein